MEKRRKTTKGKGLFQNRYDLAYTIRDTVNQAVYHTPQKN